MSSTNDETDDRIQSHRMPAWMVERHGNRPTPRLVDHEPVLSSGIPASWQARLQTEPWPWETTDPSEPVGCDPTCASRQDVVDLFGRPVDLPTRACGYLHPIDPGSFGRWIYDHDEAEELERSDPDRFAWWRSVCTEHDDR